MDEDTGNDAPTTASTATEVRVDIQLLGNVELRRTEHPHDVVRLARSAERCVLATLAFNPGHLVSTATLIDNLGPTRRGTEPTPTTLNGYIRTLRVAINRAGGTGTSLRTVPRSHAYILDIDPHAIDYHRIRAQAATCKTDDPDQLEELLNNWPLEALADIDCSWANNRRHTLNIERSQLYEQLLNQRLAAHQYDRAFHTVTTLIEHTPPTEPLLLAGARALTGSDQQPAIPDWIAYGTQRMRETFDAELSPDFHAAITQLTANRVSDRHSERCPRTDPIRTARTVPDDAPNTRLTTEPTAMSTTAQGGEDTTAMFTLPADLPEFTGRDEELRYLLDIVSATQTWQARAIEVHAIDGMAGIGKTTFSVHAAHRLADRFPDGLMFHRLHGFTPGHTPTSPSEALFSLLVATGMAPQAIPRELDDRARQWRNRMTGKKFLLILDDAADHDQIRPLLPASAGSLVLITSRRRLPALDGVRSLPLDLMSNDQATTMLIRLAGLDPDSKHGEAITEIVQLCEHLPLAIALAAARLRSHPTWTPRHLADLLKEGHRLLDHLAVGDRSLRAAFDISFDNLSKQRQHTYTLIGGVHPGPEIDAYALAALTQEPLHHAEQELEALHNDHLIQETSPGRYRLHDLLHIYTNTLADALAPAERHEFFHRLLDYYLHTAHVAATHLAHFHTPTVASSAPPPPAHQPTMADQRQARRWLDTELATLDACIQHAQSTHPKLSLALATTLHPYVRMIFSLDLAQRIQQTALNVVQRSGDQYTHAKVLLDLGVVHHMRSQLESAERCLTQAQDIYSNLGDQHGGAHVLLELGVLHYMRGQYGPAKHYLTQAHDVYTNLGDQLGQASSLSELGIVDWLQGQYEQAEQNLTQAQNIYASLGDQHGHANTLTNLGIVHRIRGQYEQAEQNLTQAQHIHVDTGFPLGHANAVANLGIVHRMRGEYTQAEESLIQAQRIYIDIGEQYGHANTLNHLGRLYHQQRRHHVALDYLTRAHSQFTEVGDPDGEAETLNSLGDLALDYPQAGNPHSLFIQAHSIAHDIGTPEHEAHALYGLGRYAEKTADIPEAIRAFRAALSVYNRLNSPETETIAKQLATIESIEDQNTTTCISET